MAVITIQMNTEDTADVAILARIFAPEQKKIVDPPVPQTDPAVVGSITPEEKPKKKRGRPKKQKEPNEPEGKITLEDLRNKARAFLKDHGAAPMQKLLQKFEVAKVSDLGEDKWVEFLGAMIDYDG